MACTCRFVIRVALRVNQTIARQARVANCVLLAFGTMGHAAWDAGVCALIQPEALNTLSALINGFNAAMQ